ncbi:MAG: hypothetical protein R3B70_06905 [Polyangiaceae bacterium]
MRGAGWLWRASVVAGLAAGLAAIGCGARSDLLAEEGAETSAGGSGGGSTTGTTGTTSTPTPTPTATTSDTICEDDHTALPPTDPAPFLCQCDASKGIFVDGICGEWALVGSYDPDNQCDLDVPFSTASICKENRTWKIYGCHETQVTPCADIELDGEEGAIYDVGGTLLDGAGATWEIEGQSSEPEWIEGEVSSLTGTMTVTASKDGVSVPVTISYSVCVPFAIVCPI